MISGCHSSLNLCLRQSTNKLNLNTLDLALEAFLAHSYHNLALQQCQVSVLKGLAVLKVGLGQGSVFRTGILRRDENSAAAAF